MKQAFRLSSWNGNNGKWFDGVPDNQTDDNLMVNKNGVISILNDLRALGVRLAIE